MKPLLALPVLLAAFAGAAFLGPSAASAAVLCKVNTSPCSADDVVEKETQLGLVMHMTFGGNAYVCSTFPAASGAVTSAGGEGEAVKATITSLSAFAFCTVGGGVNCPLTGPNLPYDTEYQGSGGNGSMVLSDPVAVQFKVQCGGSSCTFSTTNKIEFTYTGGMPAKMVVNNVPFTSEGGCPTSMSGQYTNFGPFFSQFIVGGPVPGPGIRLCQENVGKCPEAKRQPIGSAIEGTLEGKSVFEFLYEGLPREPACEEGSLTGKTTAAGKPLLGEVNAMSFAKCGAGVCAMQAQNLSFKAEIEMTTGGNGTLALVSGGSGSPKIEVNCGKAFQCSYQATSVSLSVTGGNPAKLGASATLEKDPASEAECGSTMTWKATYKLTKPTGSLFVTS